MAGGDPGKEELRIALVMNGGVSLAVWIGGVVREIARLLSGASAYGQLAELLAIDPRVDVIAGTSAGGVNGAYLAMAMAYHDRSGSLDQAAAGLRALWVDSGAIELLLRSPLEKTPPSLLDGDGFYYDTLRKALQDLKGQSSTAAADVPVDLILTATLLKGAGKHYADDYGSPVVDVSHRAYFRFRRNTCDDQFTKPSSAAQLALAARTTSSFPGAFEPSFCPVGADDGDRPDMTAVASFKQSRFLIDGGILDNKPLDVALASIFEQRAVRPTRRVLAYIVPAPESTAAVRTVPETRGDDPGLLKIVLSSLVEIPSVQSISAQLEALRAHNKAVREKRRSRIVITRCNSPAEIDALAGTLFESYRDMRVTRALDYVIGEINEGLLGEAGSAPFGRRGRREWLCGTLSALRGELPWIPTVPPLPEEAAAAERGPDGWRWGARPVEHFAQFLLDLVVRVQRIAATRRTPPDLARYWTAAFDAIEGSKQLRSEDRGYWRAQAAKVVEALGTGLETRTPAASARDWFKESFLGWATKVKPSGELAAKIAENIRQLAPVAFALADEVAGAADQALVRDAEDLRKLFAYFVRGPADLADPVLARLLAFEVVQEALGAEGEDLEEEVDFIQISGDDDVADGSGRKAEDKLNGVQLAHFGAFYKRSWRANDWLWGRRDAVRRLVRLLIDPARLKTIAGRRDPPLSSAEMADALIAIAGGFGNPAADPSWSAQFKPDRAAIAAELSYLDDDSIPVPERLPRITEAIAHRLELEILCAELPALASAIDADQKGGLATSTAIAGFAAECAAAARSGDWLTAAAGLKLGPRCSLGEERLAAEIGTDPATKSIAQALAVSVAAVGGDKRISASLGGAIAFLRAPTLLFYAFARNLALRSRTGLAINAAVAAAAAVIVGTAIASTTNPYPALVVAIAGGALAASAFLLLSRLGAVRWLVAALILLAVVAALYFGLARLSLAAWRGLAIVEGGLLGLLLLGRFLLRGQKRKKRAAGADGGT